MAGSAKWDEFFSGMITADDKKKINNEKKLQTGRVGKKSIGEMGKVIKVCWNIEKLPPILKKKKKILTFCNIKY